MNIREKKIKLRDAIREDDLKCAIETSKDLGLSMQHICRVAKVNVGNLCRYIHGKLPFLNEEHKQQVYTVMKEVLLNEI